MLQADAFAASCGKGEQLKQALDTMGIMAHELRTPLATMNLIGEAMRQEVRPCGRMRQEQVEHLARRLLALVRNMHRQIDTQITNARLLRLPPAAERVSAAGLLREAMASHPFRHEKEQHCIELQVRRDFEFDTVRSLFLQVIDNLLRNALRSLASLPGQPHPGDLRLEIDQPSPRWGCIRVIDRGTGIPPHLQARLFQPFVSSHHASCHGLGLAFCQRVVHRSGGRLRVESAPGEGATFIIELPLAAKPRILYLCSPNNPTGAVLKRETLERAGAIVIGPARSLAAAQARLADAKATLLEKQMAIGTRSGSRRVQDARKSGRWRWLGMQHIRAYSS